MRARAPLFFFSSSSGADGGGEAPAGGWKKKRWVRGVRVPVTLPGCGAVWRHRAVVVCGPHSWHPKDKIQKSEHRRRKSEHTTRKSEHRTRKSEYRTRKTEHRTRKSEHGRGKTEYRSKGQGQKGRDDGATQTLDKTTAKAVRGCEKHRLPQSYPTQAVTIHLRRRLCYDTCAWCGPQRG